MILVPPGWVHATVNVSQEETMSFGAWCVRDYGFEYESVRRHRGIAFFPLWQGEDLVWVKNPTYRGGTFLEKNARPYPEFGLTRGIPIYRQYEENRNLFRFVTHPQEFSQLWEGYQP